MNLDLPILDLARARAAHAGSALAVAARNVANADTPGYRALGAAAFDPGAGSGVALHHYREGHLGASVAGAVRMVPRATEASPNGNAVSVEQEIFAAAEAGRDQSRAIAVWRHSLTVLRTALGR